MQILFDVNAWLAAGLIFLMRVSDMTLDTLRVLVVMRGKKPLAWVLGFFQSSIFVLAITSVLSNLDNPLNMVGYAAGFATGNVMGMWIEERLAIGHLHLRIISSRRGAAIAEALRAQGYAVTEIPARGKDGTVSLLTISVLRRNAGEIQELIRSIDEDAFITAEDVRPVHRGFWRS
ncbi:MAG: DUF2179 domain-containing protein [Anaerolineales bacterium]|nr:DUF2179 domain-containing protein [Anaerolineales bacterium]MCS7246927.1 DUF2179 domain-containing protein [Anaerolineales bacterium]MDW8160738.1 DUF2179 domain-containing protein [Anaerolineales bacterium]MDW8447493.1 DUF2179 domain-containing protein [Anaerolineales bacterium]